MRRYALVTALAVALAVPLSGQGPQFDVVSLKRNTSNEFQFGPATPPGPGQVRLTRIPLRNLILQGYPLETLPIQVENLPAWASDYYDVEAKGNEAASPDERQQMFRAMLTDRLKLAAHYEMREQAGYNLVFARADHAPGPGLKPSTLGCTDDTPQLPSSPAADGPDAFKAAGLKRCRSFVVEGDTIRSGGALVANLVRMVTPAAGRPITDRTGLAGYFDITLRYQRIPPRSTAEPDPNAAPSLFTALQEQLGLKLESSTTQGQVLVIDHIERPTEN